MALFSLGGTIAMTSLPGRDEAADAFLGAEQLLSAVPGLAGGGRVPVVLASRTGAGSVLARSSGFSGAENPLLSHGLVSAGFLDPLKARLLLHALLSRNASRDEVAAAFAAHGAA